MIKLKDVIERELGVCFKDIEDYKKYKEILISKGISIFFSDNTFSNNRYFAIIGGVLRHGSINNPNRTRELINFEDIDLGIKKTNVK